MSAQTPAYDEALVERVATVMAEAFGWDWMTEDDGPPPVFGCDSRTPSAVECCTDTARAVLDALRAEGWRQVVEPTCGCDDPHTHDQAARYRGLLGAARRELDDYAVRLGEHPGQDGWSAADMAQRIVDYIGHSVTDEPARAAELAEDVERLRAEVERLRAATAQRRRKYALAEMKRLRYRPAPAERLVLGLVGIFAVTYGIGAAAGGSEIGGAGGLTAGGLVLWALLRGEYKL